MDAVVTVPSVNGFVQTFPLVIHRATLPWLREALEGGRGGCFQAFQAAAAGLEQMVRVLQMEQAVEDGRLHQLKEQPLKDWFLSVNEPADLARAEACLADR